MYPLFTGISPEEMTFAACGDEVVGISGNELKHSEATQCSEDMTHRFLTKSDCWLYHLVTLCAPLAGLQSGPEG